MSEGQDEEAPRGPGWRPWLARAVFESAMIVLSVFLALALDGWRQDRETERKVRDVRAYFVEEITANRSQLASAGYAPLHVRMAAAWRRLAAIERPKAADRDEAWQTVPTGMHPFKGRDAVWRSFSSSDLMQHMPSREVFALADVYRAQEELNEANRQLLDKAIVITALEDDTAFIRSQAKAQMMSVNDVTYAEEVLLKRYDAALALIRKDGKAP